MFKDICFVFIHAQVKHFKIGLQPSDDFSLGKLVLHRVSSFIIMIYNNVIYEFNAIRIQKSIQQKQWIFSGNSFRKSNSIIDYQWFFKNLIPNVCCRTNWRPFINWRNIKLEIHIFKNFFCFFDAYIEIFLRVCQYIHPNPVRDAATGIVNPTDNFKVFRCYLIIQYLTGIFQKDVIRIQKHEIIGSCIIHSNISRTTPITAVFV